MSMLAHFSAEETDLIVFLPYRAGLWVSLADDTGGQRSQGREIAALDRILAERARLDTRSAFVREIFSAYAARQSAKTAWEKRGDALLADCTLVIDIISKKLEESDVDAYRASIMAIGLAVAKSFREHDEGLPLPAKLGSLIGLGAEFVMKRLRRDKSHDYESAFNISYHEDVALTALSKALHPGT